MILDRVTLKQGKTHCGRGLMRILNKISRLVWNPLRCMCILHKSMGMESSAVSNVYGYSFGLHRNLIIKKSDNNDKLLSTEATFGFCLLC